jgi:pimeloyl-ACP methyl ester carboxylesterase
VAYGTASSRQDQGGSRSERAVPSARTRALHRTGPIHLQGAFFYQIYFQQEGVAEAELEADTASALRKLYFALSGRRHITSGSSRNRRGETAGWAHRSAALSGLDERERSGRLCRCVSAGGFRGPLNRYRAQTLDFADLAELGGRSITQPSAFIAGERDPVRAFVPGVDLYADPGIACSDFRGSTIIPGIGHWVQQEAPNETNAALEAFVRRL